MNGSIRYLTVVALAFSTSACFNVISGNGTLQEEIREVPTFSAVDIEGMAEIEFVVDPTVEGTVTLEVSGDANLVPLLETRVEGDRLIIDMDDWAYYYPTMPLKISAVVPDLVEVDASGSTSVQVDGLDTQTLDVHTSGSSHVSLNGTVDVVRFDTSGSSHIDARDLLSHELYIEASGSSYYEVCADERLEVDASGSSMVRYYCAPEVVVTDISGSASVVPASE